MDSNHRLHLATRIHFALLRELGSGIDVGLMLSRDLYALDVINVCRASDNEELEHLAEQFVRASRVQPADGAAATRPAPVRPRPVTPFPAQPTRSAWWRSLGAVIAPAALAAR
jgi:hypothetical protein